MLLAVDPGMLLTQLNKALMLVQNYTINTLGQSSVFPGKLTIMLSACQWPIRAFLSCLSLCYRRSHET